MTTNRDRTKPAPLETEPGQQQDDNIDDLGRRPDGTEQDQPTKPSGKNGEDKAVRGS
jgi:hypothetical protein